MGWSFVRDFGRRRQRWWSGCGGDLDDARLRGLTSTLRQPELEAANADDGGEEQPADRRNVAMPLRCGARAIGLRDIDVGGLVQPGFATLFSELPRRRNRPLLRRACAARSRCLAPCGSGPAWVRRSIASRGQARWRQGAERGQRELWRSRRRRWIERKARQRIAHAQCRLGNLFVVLVVGVRLFVMRCMRRRERDGLGKLRLCSLRTWRWRVPASRRPSKQRPGEDRIHSGDGLHRSLVRGLVVLSVLRFVLHPDPWRCDRLKVTRSQRSSKPAARLRRRPAPVPDSE